MLSPIRLVFAATVLVLALFGLFSSLVATPEPGLGLSSNGAVVSDVVPGSPAWRDGIRAGDRIVSLRDASEPEGWAVQVTDGVSQRETSAASELARLRASVPTGFAAVLVGAVGVLLLLQGTVAGIALFPIAVGLAIVPLRQTGSMFDLLLAGPAAVVLAGASVALIKPRRHVASAAMLVVIALATLWLTTFTGRSAWFDVLDSSHAPIAFAFAGWGAWLAIDRRSLVRRLASPSGPALFDLLYASFVLAGLAGLVILLGVSPAAALLGGVVALIAYPATRRASARVFERLVVGTMRREAAIRAIEDERGRLAREIHDAPLQGLAAVIRRLDDRPDAAQEASELRDVAGQLRDVATALHPPVLEDLGLVPALIDLSDTLAATSVGMSVTVDVDDLMLGGSRPPTNVEMAAFRIVQEAAGNAMRHSAGRTITIRGSAGPDVVDLSVIDDGSGFDRAAAQHARRSGHFGLDSMRERADAVGGELEITSGASGTVVRFLWELRP